MGSVVEKGWGSENKMGIYGKCSGKGVGLRTKRYIWEVLWEKGGGLGAKGGFIGKCSGEV